MSLMSGQQPLDDWVSALRCPLDGDRLDLVDTATWRSRLGDVELVCRRSGTAQVPDVVLVRRDRPGAYPVLDGVPVLMAPELLVPAGAVPPLRVDQAQYEEAYEEMAFYNAASVEVTGDALADSREFRDVARARTGDRGGLLVPSDAWLDEPFDALSQRDAYEHIAPVAGERTLQLGGKGMHAVKFLLAGAAEAWLATPMYAEAEFAHELAARFGVADRLRSVLCVAEELPFDDGFFGVVYSGSSVHHMVTELAFPEIHRVLDTGGRFAAIDPFRAPMYGVGTRVFGKRDSVHCQPLTNERIAPLTDTFADARVEGHGALVRYPMLAFEKVAGYRPPMGRALRIAETEDRVAQRLRVPDKWCSTVALLATKRPSDTPSHTAT